MNELLPISDRIKGLSYKDLDRLYNSLITFNCSGLDCDDCPLRIKGQMCMTAQVFAEHKRRRS